VRYHVAVQRGAALPDGLPRAMVLALSAVAYSLMQAPATLQETVQRVAEPVGLQADKLQETARRVEEQLDAARQGYDSA
jgi:hypothetical protein